MISRRTFLQTASAAAATVALPLPSFATPNDDAAADPLKWVDPRIGTGGHGHCFPGASVPFAAVQLSPDTYNDGWDWCAGYHRSDTSIMGFSHTHLSGTGCGDLLDFLVMAGIGPVKLEPGPRSNPNQGYRSRFDHEDEVIKPGYYAVMLQDPKVHVELTSTERTGIHRYTFPQSNEAWLILDLTHSYQTNKSSSVYKAELSRPTPASLAGGHVTRAWGHDRRCFFHLEISKTPSKVVFYSNGKPLGDTTPVAGDDLKAVLHFKTKANEAILVRTGISGVSAEGAAKNLRAEQPDFDFAKTCAAAQDKWRAQLSRVDVDIADPDQKRIFYTSLYHMSLGPQLFEDVDGSYRGMDAQIHQVPAGHHNYTAFSLWDTFRAAHPAYTLIQGDRVPDFANTLIRMAEQSPAGMAVWPLQGTETGTMTGYHSASVIAEAIMKGFAGIDPEAAYKVINERAMVENYRGLGYYRQMGYIPSDREEESVSKTFEYCYDDWALAHVAKKIGKHEEAAMLRNRSLNYKHYFNPKSTFMEPKLEDGSFATPFDPIEMGHSKQWRDFTESNSWQTSFGVQHDPAGLIALYGGEKPFVTKLDGLFSAAPDLPPDAPPDIAGLVGQYAHGNEPSHHIAYLYVYAGVPHKTQARVRSLMETMYRAEPNGMEGNEDVGQMSAWFLLSALGFYPVDPVSGNYVLGSPLVDRATVQLGGGKTLKIDVKRSNPKDCYVQAFLLNGKPQQRAWFHHTEIAQGGTMLFEMGPEAKTSFASSPAHLPPSLTL